MTVRTRRHLLTLTALGSLVAGIALAAPSQASAIRWPAPLPTAQRLYFHSAAGGYLNDWKADPGIGDAPAGSTLSLSPPTGSTAASVLSVTTQKNAGEPNYATFGFPFSGPLSTLCLDIWAQSTHNAIGSAQALYVYVAFVPPGVPQAQSKPVTPLAVIRVDGYDATEKRVTDLVRFAPGTTVPAGSALIIGADAYAQNFDWTMRYDSKTAFGSIRPNAVTCTPQIAAAPALISYAGPTKVKKGTKALLLTRVTDPAGKPLAGQRVTFTVESASYVKAVTATSKADGSVLATWTATPAPGAYDLTIDVPGTATIAGNTGRVALSVT